MSQPNPSLYVGNLAADISEHALFEHFKEIGPIVSVRVCVDAQDNRKSLGYGYVNFQNPGDADVALERLNATKLGGQYIRVSRVERDPSKRRSGQNNLVITHLPAQFDIPDLKELFSKYGTITSLHIATDEKGASRGYGHVMFATPDAAQAAIDEVNGLEISNQKITVTAYNHSYQEEKKKNFCNLYVRDINSNVNSESLAKILGQFGTVTSATVRVDEEGKSKRFGYCCFATHEEAVTAIEACNEKVVPELSEGDAPVKMDRFISRSERIRNQEKARQLRRAENAKYPSIYVKNFDETVTDEILRDFFSRCGEVRSAHVMRDRNNTNISRGFGFVTVKDLATAERCMAELRDTLEISKGPLYVAQAMRRDARRSQMQNAMNQARRMPGPSMGGPMGMFPMGRFGAMPPMGNMGMPMGMNGGGMGMGPRQMARPMAARPMPVARPPMSQPIAQPQQQSLAMMIANMNPEQAKNVMGERIYNTIIQKHPNEAAKVTGMLLEMESNEILMLLENPDQLDAKVNEALNVLAQHQVM